MAGVTIGLSLLGFTSLLAAALVVVLIVVTAAATGGAGTISVGIAALMGSILLSMCVAILRLILVMAEEYLYWAIGWMVLTGILTFCLFGGVIYVFPILGLIGSLAILIASCAGLVGWVQCFAVPRESGVKWWAVGAAVCLLGCVCAIGRVLYLGTGPAFRQGNPLLIPGFDTAIILAYALGVVGHLLFTLFLHGIPRFFGDHNLSGDVHKYLYFHIGLMLAGFVVSALIRESLLSGAVAGLLVLVIQMLGVANVVWFLRLLAGVRDDIRPYFRE